MRKISKDRFPEYFEKKVAVSIRNNSLFTRKHKILIACSGGKDSTAALYILKKQGYNVQAITVDALIGNYTKTNLENLRKFCSRINVKLHVISFRDEFGKSLCYIRQTLAHKGVKLRSCTICGVLRRYLLNKAAKSIKADYIVTGHNLDDEAQSIMMNLLRNQLEVGSRLGPKTGTRITGPAGGKRSFVQRVKPLYFCSEKDVIRYSMIMDFPVNYEPCPCRRDSYRNKVRILLDNLEESSPDIKSNIVKSFQAFLPLLKDSYAPTPQSKQGYCAKCGEPSKGLECSTCKILKRLEH